eukprot:CAMPEP_0170308560 /NCGR_PEP_ID=MMETSP0116_2-20130129/54723_1 /TAXON_ID=400756 /ORGANISM="Durinskia baltica, Strain CSIRO CS-38" /LENGTH=106 /DNA_ID=CAMNT_0010560749 /DNA_START=18 /DNA_END=336 /DNA_ORIENTATION=-
MWLRTPQSQPGLQKTPGPHSRASVVGRQDPASVVGRQAQACTAHMGPNGWRGNRACLKPRDGRHFALGVKHPGDSKTCVQTGACTEACTFSDGKLQERRVDNGTIW